MKSIGEKIKEIRNNKELSQQNLVYGSKHNQSLVSQIEKGDIKNPNENTLKIFADNMGVHFDELVDGTDWDRSMSKVKKTEYAISQTDPIVTLEKSGGIKVKMKSYPRYNDAGDENKYCPNTGGPLVTECSDCQRTIESPQSFCMGCGQFIVHSGPPYIIEKYPIKTEISNDLAVNKSEQKRIMNILSNRNYGPLLYEAINGDSWSLIEFTEMIYDLNGAPIVSKDELKKGMKSTVEEIRRFFIREEYERNYFKGLLAELKRYEILIIEKSGETDSIQNDNDAIDSNEERNTESYQEEE
jgi:transcriptional regulator with XRE-family HTH domain